MESPVSPESIVVPGPPGLLHALLVLTFILHVLFLNVTLGGSSLGVLYCFKQPTLGRRLAADITRWNIHGIAFTAVTGLVPMLFLLAIYGRFYLEAASLLGAFWILILVVFILGSSSTFFQRFSRMESQKPWMIITAVCFLVVGAVFTIVTVLALRPDLWPEVQLKIGAALQPLSLVPRFLHFLVGAVAFSAFLVVLYQIRRPAATQDEETYRRWAAGVGLRWARWMTVIELGIGVWFLVTLPQIVLRDVMGKSPYAMVTLLLGILFSIVLVIILFAIQDPIQEKKKVAGAFHTFLVVIIVMVLLRDAVRGVYLAGLFDPSQLVVESQWLVVSLYIVFLILTLGSASLSIRNVLRS